MKITVADCYDLGATPAGTRHIDILGCGTFEGPRLRGSIIAGGIDEKMARRDGAMVPNVRVTLKTDDNALIYMHYTGLRHGPADVMRRIAAGEIVAPDTYYLRNTPSYETAAPRYQWLTRIVSVGVGRREADHAAYEIFEIL